MRHILYLLSLGYYYETAGNERIKIFEIIDNYNKQLFSLAITLGKESSAKINLSEFSKAIMKGQFDASFLSKDTPF